MERLLILIYMVVMTLIVSCSLRRQQIHQSIIYDSLINELTIYLDSLNGKSTDSIWILFNYDFNGILNVKSDGISIIDSGIITDYSLGLAGCFLIPKKDKVQRLEIMTDNIPIADFIADTKYRYIHIYRIADSTIVEFTNNIRVYE